MKLFLDPRPLTLNTVTAHGAGYVAINGERYERSLIVAPERIETDWGPPTPDALTQEDFLRLAAFECDVLLLGTGRRQRFPARPLLEPLRSRGRVVEIMDTPAACRTYNILLAEGRAVAAALIIEPAPFEPSP